MSDGPGVTNPMLYDPIQETSQQTSKLMQFIAAIGGKTKYLCMQQCQF